MMTLVHSFAIIFFCKPSLRQTTGAEVFAHTKHAAGDFDIFGSWNSDQTLHNFEPQNLPIDFSELHKTRRPEEFWSQKRPFVPSGSTHIHSFVLFCANTFMFQRGVHETKSLFFQKKPEFKFLEIAFCAVVWHTPMPPNRIQSTWAWSRKKHKPADTVFFARLVSE